MRLYAILTPFITLALSVIFVVFNGGYLATTYSELSSGRFDGDFEHYYGSALRLRKGDNPYTAPLNSTLREHDIAPSAPALRATNPPGLVLLSIATTYFDPLTAFWAWNIFQLIMFLIGIVAFLKSLGTSSPRSHAVIGILAACCSYPVLFHIRHGQTQLLIAGIIMLALAMIRKRPHLACFLLGVSGSLKLFTLPLALVVARLSYQDRIFRPSYLVLFLLGFLLLPGFAELATDEWIHLAYFREIIPYIRDFHFTSSQGVSLSFLLFSLFTSPVIDLQSFALDEGLLQPVISIIVASTLFILLGLDYLRNRNPYDPIRGALFTLTACVLCSPVAWAHYFVLLYPAIIYLWYQSQTTHHPRLSTILILFLMTGLTIGYTPTLPVISTVWGPLVLFMTLRLLFREKALGKAPGI